LFTALAVALAVLMVGLQAARSGYEEAERLALARQAEFRQLGQEIVTAANAMSNAVRSYAAFGEPRHLEAYQRELTETRTRQRVMEKLQTLGAPEAEIALIRQSIANSAELETLEADAIRWVDRGDLGRGRGMLFDESYDIERAKAMEPIQRFLEQMSARTRAEAERAKAAADWFATISLIVIAATAASMVAIIYLFFGRGVVRPLAELSEIVKRLADEDYSVAPPPTRRTDEIGDLIRAITTFRDNGLAKQRLEAEATAQKARAEAEKKQILTGLADSFEANVKTIVHSVACASQRMESAARTLTTLSGDTTRQVAVVASSSEHALNNVQTVAAATEELSASINEIGRRVTDSSQIAREAVAQADGTNARIGSLAEAVGRIGDVVQLIQDIASQTNLLALNATIEAARAGEAGKGFAVVASEVKLLATQTAKATEEISAQIASVQTATGGAVEAIRAIGLTITRISDIATSIAAAVEEQASATSEIARSVQQAASDTMEVTRTIADVNRAAGETGVSAEQVLVAADDLGQQSVRLDQEVERLIASIRMS